jgi:hypothetical protein
MIQCESVWSKCRRPGGSKNNTQLHVKSSLWLPLSKQHKNSVLYRTSKTGRKLHAKLVNGCQSVPVHLLLDQLAGHAY